MKPFRRCAAIAAIAVAALAAGQGIVEATEITPDQKKAIERIVRDYIVGNPEVLQEAMQELERRQQDAQRVAQREAVTAQKEAIFESPGDAVIGNTKGNATLVVFHDYNCPYCKKAAADLDELIKEDANLRVVLKEFPVVRPPDSLEAAKLALAARHQLSTERYREFHMRLMAIKGLVNRDRVLELARDMKLDQIKLVKDSDAEEIRQTLQRTVQLGDRLGITGTPAFVVGDAVISGAVGKEPLRAALQSVRSCGKTLC